MKKNGWLVLVAFLAGILLANLSGKELLTTCGILNTYFLDQYAYSVIQYDSLFCSVFMERLKTVIILIMLGKILNGRGFAVVVESLAAAAFGFLMVVAIANLGVRGLVITLCALLPQWIFYLMAITLYASHQMNENYAGVYGGSVQTKQISMHAGICVMLVVLLLLGIVTESYLNPVLLKKLLKIF